MDKQLEEQLKAIQGVETKAYEAGYEAGRKSMINEALEKEKQIRAEDAKVDELEQEEVLTDMFGEGGKEEIKEFYGEPTPEQENKYDAMKEKPRCPKCGDEVTGDEDGLCHNCI